mgnify:CR=1 FL=1
MTTLLLIDPQNDFHTGSLAVPGAVEDAQRLVTALDPFLSSLARIIVTLDKHGVNDISHPGWFKDSEGNPPPPFTAVTSADLEEGRWMVSRQEREVITRAYLRLLEESEGPHTIWPPHCIWGTWGGNVEPNVAELLHKWQSEHLRNVIYVEKGMNRYTEHFSAVRSCVPMPDDKATQTNRDFVDRIEASRKVIVAGQAMSHCVGKTMLDLLSSFRDPTCARNLYLVTDATSPVPGFEDQAHEITRRIVAAGVNTVTCQQLHAVLATP